MAYTKETLKADLRKVGSWRLLWAAKPGQVRTDVLKANAGASSSGFEELSEYCWKAYESAYKSAGHMVIGRVPDLNAAGLYAKVAEVVTHSTNFNKGTLGNLLKQDKWALTVNDSWILGGIHRQAIFRLASPRVIENLWSKDGYFVVTARELIGLVTFGYLLEQVGPWQCLSCKSPELATGADLVKYDATLAKRQSFREAYALKDAQGSSARAQQQVQAFHKK